MDQKLVEQAKRLVYDRRPPIIAELIREELRAAAEQAGTSDKHDGASRQ